MAAIRLNKHYLASTGIIGWTETDREIESERERDKKKRQRMACRKNVAYSGSSVFESVISFSPVPLDSSLLQPQCNDP